MTVFITTAFPVAQQGLAGGFISSVLQLGVALCLIIQSETVKELALGRSYKNTFWFGVGAGAVSLVLMGAWGRVPMAKSDLTADEKGELIREAKLEEQGGGAGGGGAVVRV